MDKEKMNEEKLKVLNSTLEKLEKTFGSKTDIIIKGGTLSPVASSVVDLTDPAHPRLLRQGAITREQLEHCLGQILE